jgi:membrane-bound lytic murein transglycosylase D
MMVSTRPAFLVLAVSAALLFPACAPKKPAESRPIDIEQWVAVASTGSGSDGSLVDSGGSAVDANGDARSAAGAGAAAGAMAGANNGSDPYEDVIDRLYDELTDSLLEFESGMEFAVAGDEMIGQRRIDSAVDRLRAASAECSITPGCEIDRFFEAFDYLLEEQGLELKKLIYRVETMQAGLDEGLDREPGTTSFVGTMPELSESVSLLRGTDLRTLIEMNGPVSAALDDWLTWMRPNLMKAYENYQFLRPSMAPVYEESGLPEALLFAMIATESGGKVHAYSRAGAAGPLQFMRYTGRKYGLTVVDDFDLRLDPESSTRANVAYLNDHFAQFNNSLEKVLAAYNGGENRMKSLERRYKGASLWDKRVYYSLPRETREYVPRVLAAAWLFLHPEDYQLEFPSIDAATVALTLKRDASVGELAICLGQEGNSDGWFRTLRNLNPRLEPKDRVKAGEEIVVPATLAEVYDANCLEGDLVDLAVVLHDANYPDEPVMIRYTVRRGDSLGKIAKRFPCASIGEIAALNRVRPPRYVIRVGQTLRIPTCE